MLSDPAVSTLLTPDLLVLDLLTLDLLTPLEACPDLLALNLLTLLDACPDLLALRETCSNLLDQVYWNLFKLLKTWNLL